MAMLGLWLWGKDGDDVDSNDLRDISDGGRAGNVLDGVGDPGLS